LAAILVNYNTAVNVVYMRKLYKDGLPLSRIAAITYNNQFWYKYNRLFNNMSTTNSVQNVEQCD